MRASTSRATRAPTAGTLHDWRNGDAHDRQAPNQFTTHHGDGGKQKLFPLLLRLAQDGMAVVEGVKKLGELENMFRQVRWLRGGNTLVDHVGRLGRRAPQFPEFVAAVATQIFRQ